MNVPKLRFSEFNDEYYNIILEAVSTITMGQSPSSENYNTDIENSILIQGNADLQNGKVVPRIYTTQITKTCDINDIIMTVRAPVGDIAISEYNACIGRGVCAIKGNKYIYHYLEYLRQIKYWDKISKGSTIDSVTSNDIKRLPINIPSEKEQEKISNMLSLLDKKIELQSKKIEDLKLYKKGLYVYLMKHASEYKIIKLGKLCNITTGKLDANAMKRNGKYRFYTCAEDYYYVDEYAFDTEALLISGNGANVGYIHYYKGKFNAYQRTYVLDNFIEDINYIKIFLDNNLKSRISSEVRAGNTPYITLSTLSEMNISIPIKEDDINLFNSINLIDNKIQLNNTRLNKLQELKKGLMQNMFV